MSQKDAILSHLKRGPITPIQALNEYGCFRLAAVIHKLRDAGHWIETEMVDKPGGDGQYARYRLKRKR